MIAAGPHPSSPRPVSPVRQSPEFITVAALACILLTVCSEPCRAQGESAVPFLLIPPSAESQGMGWASVASHTEDPLSGATNPAQIGVLAFDQRFSFTRNYAKWLPGFAGNDVWIRTRSLNGGLGLRDLDAKAPPLYFGLAFSRIFLNLGEFSVTTADGPDIIATFQATERADLVTIGIGYDGPVDISLGLSVKHIVSDILTGGIPGVEPVPDGNIADAYDLGMLIDLPILDLVTDLPPDRPFFPYFNWRAGLSINNGGGETISYYDSGRGDPLPRYARAGTGLDFGVAARSRGVSWKIFSFKWTGEVGSILVRRYPELRDASGSLIREGGWNYRPWPGAIHLPSDVISPGNNREIERKRGWEVNLFEFFAIRGGRFEEAPERGGRRFDTSGWSVRLSGLMKMIGAADECLTGNALFGLLADHIDVRYNHSSLETDERGHPLQLTSFNSVDLIISR